MADCTAAPARTVSAPAATPVRAAIEAFNANEAEYKRLSAIHTAAEEAKYAVGQKYSVQDEEGTRLMGRPMFKPVAEPWPADYAKAVRAEEKADRAYQRALDKRDKLARAVLKAAHTNRAEAIQKIEFYARVNGAKKPHELSFEHDLSLVLAEAMKIILEVPPPPPTPQPSVLRQQQAERERRESELNATFADLPEETCQAMAARVTQIDENIVRLPIHTRDDAAVKLEEALADERRGFVLQADNERFRQVLAYLRDRGPVAGDVSPLAYHLAEYRRLWADGENMTDEEREAIEKVADEQHAQIIWNTPCASFADALVKLDMATERFRECADEHNFNGFSAEVNTWALKLAQEAFDYINQPLGGSNPDLEVFSAYAEWRKAEAALEAADSAFVPVEDAYCARIGETPALLRLGGWTDDGILRALGGEERRYVTADDVFSLRTVWLPHWKGWTDPHPSHAAEVERAERIVATWDEREAHRQQVDAETGYSLAKAAGDAAEADADALRRKLIATPARTPAGVGLKALSAIAVVANNDPSSLIVMRDAIAAAGLSLPEGVETWIAEAVERDDDGERLFDAAAFIDEYEAMGGQYSLFLYGNTQQFGTMHARPSSPRSREMECELVAAPWKERLICRELERRGRALELADPEATAQPRAEVGMGQLTAAE